MAGVMDLARSYEAVNAVKRRVLPLPEPLRELHSLGNLRLSALVGLLETATRLERRAKGEPFQDQLDFVQARGLLKDDLDPSRHLKTIAALIAVYKYLFGRWSETVKENPFAAPVHYWALGAMLDYHIIVLEETPEVLAPPLRRFLAKLTGDVMEELPRLKDLPPRGKRWIGLVAGLVGAMLVSESGVPDDA